MQPHLSSVRASRATPPNRSGYPDQSHTRYRKPAHPPRSSDAHGHDVPRPRPVWAVSLQTDPSGGRATGHTHAPSRERPEHH